MCVCEVCSFGGGVARAFSIQQCQLAMSPILLARLARVVFLLFKDVLEHGQLVFLTFQHRPDPRVRRAHPSGEHLGLSCRAERPLGNWKTGAFGRRWRCFVGRTSRFAPSLCATAGIGGTGPCPELGTRTVEEKISICQLQLVMQRTRNFP